MRNSEILPRPVETGIVPGTVDLTSTDWQRGVSKAYLSSGSAVETFCQLTVKDGDVVKRTMEIRFVVEFLRQEDGGFVAHVPALPSASTQGRDLAEALSAVEENLCGILEDEPTLPIVPEIEREYLAGPNDLQQVLSLSVDAASSP